MSLQEITSSPFLTEEGLTLAISTVATIFPSENSYTEPSPAARKVADVFNLMASGVDVEIIPVQAELTVSQAARFLKMSEGRLNELLDDDLIEYRLEGGQRMVQRESILEFERETREMEEGCAELTRISQEMGLYDD